MTTDDLVDDLESNISTPKQVTSDGTSAEQHSLPDQIAAIEFVQNQRAARRTTLPIMRTRILPGGTP